MVRGLPAPPAMAGADLGLALAVSLGNGAAASANAIKFREKKGLMEQKNSGLAHLTAPCVGVLLVWGAWRPSGTPWAPHRPRARCCINNSVRRGTLVFVAAASCS